MKRIRTLLATACLLIAGSAVIAPEMASAAATYSQLKTTTFSGAPAVGWSTCQSKYVTLPKLSSSYRYSWGEYMPSEDGLVAYNMNFAGTYYWTVCAVSEKGV